MSRHCYLAFLLVHMAHICTCVAVTERSFTVYSEPVNLRFAEVHNRNQGILKLPADVIQRYSDGKMRMAVTGYDVDMVRTGENGTEIPIKLSEFYLHHYILYVGTARQMEKLKAFTSESTSNNRLLNGGYGMTGRGMRMAERSVRSQEEADDDYDQYNFVTFGGASGAEYRHNPHKFEKPFRVLLARPEVWAPTLHIINTNSSSAPASNPYPGALVSPLLECPCTNQRVINVTAGTIDGKLADPPIHCSKEFAATGNPSCHLSTYVGGWRCCEHGMMLIDTDKMCTSHDCAENPIQTVRMKFTFRYEDAPQETRTDQSPSSQSSSSSSSLLSTSASSPSPRNLEWAACCDVTSVVQGDENIEYDVPQCGHEHDNPCTHVAESMQPLAHYSNDPDDFHGTDLVDLAFAAPHLHVAGLSLTLIDGITNETLCEVHRPPSTEDGSPGGVMYGTGDTPGNEAGYLVGLIPCTWNGTAAKRFRRDHPIQSRAVYDATHYHTGVMSLWLMQVSPVQL